MITRSTRCKTLAAPAVLALALIASPARASGAGGEIVVEGLSGLFWLSGASLGVVTDAGIGYHLLWGGGRVPRSWAITGTVAWSVATVALAVGVGESLGTPHYGPPSTPTPDEQVAGIAVASGFVAIQGGSLVLSLVALTRPPEPAPSGSTTSPARFSLSLPTIAPTRSGASVVLRGTF
jgi:hypothetical protein